MIWQVSYQLAGRDFHPPPSQGCWARRPGQLRQITPDFPRSFWRHPLLHHRVRRERDRPHRLRQVHLFYHRIPESEVQRIISPAEPAASHRFFTGAWGLDRWSQVTARVTVVWREFLKLDDEAHVCLKIWSRIRQLCSKHLLVIVSW